MNNRRESENWFFKVWSNKFLRSKILLKVKVFNDFYNNYKLDRIISCYWMIENGYFQLLKEKVEKGEYLVFNSSLIYHSKFDNKYILSQRERVNKNLENGDDEFVLNENSIFYKEKASIHWDLNFYNNLFKNYSNYFLNFNKSITESTLIQYDNQQALQVLVENFNHILEIESFFKSFEIGSYECSFYIFNKFKNEILKSKNFQSRIWNIIINNIKLSKKDINKVENLINKSVNFIINKCNIQLPPPPQQQQQQQQQFTPWLFNFQIYEQKLSLIYNCVKSIVQLKEFFKSYIKSINNNSFKFKFENKDIIETNNLVKKYIKKFVKLLVYDENGKKKKDFKIPDLKEIESMKFTNQQFNSTISDLITDGDDENYENKDIQENLRILYFSLIPFIEQYDHLIGNLIFYKVKILNEKDFMKYNHLYPKLCPKMFGIYGIYDYKYNNENYLFIYCKNNRNLQIEYIGKIIESFHNQKYPIFDLLLLFRNLVWLNDLELVNLLINKMEDNGYRFEDNDRQFLILNIKSIEMFDLIYRNFKSQSKNQNNNNNNNSNNIYNTSYPISETKFFFNTLLKSKFENLSILLQHYKDYYTNDYYTIVDLIDFKNKNYSFEVFKFVYDNLIDFKDYEKVNVWSGTNNIKLIKTLNQFKYLVKLTPINKDYKIPYGNESFFKFIIEERLNDLEIGRCDITETSLPDYRYFKIYRNYRVNKNENENENEKQLYYSFEGNNTILRNTLIKACKYNDLKFIDMVMEESFLYDQNNKDNENFKNIYIISILEVICSQGDLELFKYLYSKYSSTIDFYLIKNDKPGFDGYCLPIKLALLNGHIDFLLFILNLISDKIYINSNTTINNKLLLNHFLNEKNELLTILL